MENGYVIIGLDDHTRWCISNRAKDILQRIKPKGCPFYNYSMFNCYMIGFVCIHGSLNGIRKFLLRTL